MNVLAVCHMFPNRMRPTTGVFVKERLKYVAKKIPLSVVAPIPAFPFMNHTSKYQGLKTLEDEEIVDGLQVFHPRYFMIPKYLKFLDSDFYARSMRGCIEKLVEQYNCDILDFHWVYPDGIGGLEWARKLGKKTIVTVRGNEAIHYYEKTAVRKIIQKRLCEFDHVISVSEDLKNKILSEYNIDPLKISVIANGIDKYKFHPIDKVQAKASCGLDEKKKYVLTICRLSEEKGLEFLLEAISRMVSDQVELLLIGDGPLKTSLLKISEHLNITDRVHFIGSVDHSALCCWYNAVDIFCLPSLREGCPNVVIESLACGTAVVASSVGGIPDLVPDDRYGYLVPPGDADMLSKAIQQSLIKEWHKMDISRFGSLQSWDQVADKVIKVYEKVLS